MSDDAAESMLEWKGRTGPFTVSLGRAFRLRSGSGLTVWPVCAPGRRY